MTDIKKKYNTIETIYFSLSNSNTAYFTINIPFEVREVKVLQFMTAASNSDNNIIFKSNIVNDRVVGSEQVLVTYDPLDVGISYYRKTSNVVYHYILDQPTVLRGTYSVSSFDNTLSSVSLTGNWIMVVEFIQ